MNKNKIVKTVLILGLLISVCSIARSQTVANLVKQWGEFGDQPGQFKFPAMIVSGNNGDIYVADQHNHRIQKFDSEGKFILMWGERGEGPGEFNFPYGVALDSKGNVYVSDMNNNRIQKFNSEGTYLTAAGSYGTGDGQFKYPYGIAIDADDVVYVIDAFNYRIQKFDADLRFLDKWGTQESIGFRLYMPHEIAVNDDSIILSDRQNHRISLFDSEGTLIKRFGEFGEGKDASGGQFSEPHGIAVNENGEIFVCDRYNFRVQQFDREGKNLIKWLTPGIHDDSRHFPLGIAVNSTGDIYVTDHYAHCIQKFSIVK